MKKLLPKTLSLLFVFVIFSHFTYSQEWESVGTPGFSEGSIWFPNVKIDKNNNTYVAYLDYFEGYHKVKVKKFNGSIWEEVGITGFPTMSDRVSLALDPNGLPVIAYQTFDESLHGIYQNFTIRVKKFNGSTWVDVGTSFIHTSTTYLENAPHAYNPTLALDANGIPFVAIWHAGYLNDGSLINGVTVVKYNGNNWEAIGRTGFTNQQPDYLTFAIGPDGTPYIAYQQVYDNTGFDSRKVSVMKFDGNSWVYVGPSSFSEQRGFYPSLKIASDGTPYVAYIDNNPQVNYSTGGKPTVKKFNGSNWIDVGTGGLPDGIGNNESHSIHLALDVNDVPYIVYETGYNPDYEQFIHGRTRVQKLISNNWVDLGSGFTPSFYSRDISIDANGNPIVIFADQSNFLKATVMKYVQEHINSAPVLASIGNKSVNELSELTFQASATDDGLPNNTLTFSLVSAVSGNYPTGAAISEAGLFSWTPTEEQGPGVYKVKINVSDGELTDEEEIEIQVNEKRGIPVLSTSSTCLPDVILSVSNAADASKIEWYKDNQLVSTVKPVSASEGTTVAGGNGPGSAVNQFYFPAGVSVDGEGNVFVADQANYRVQKWTPGATEGITVAGGNGGGSAANQLFNPYGVFVDGTGNIYVADHSRVQKWAQGASQGITVAGGNGAGSAANQLHGTKGIFVDGSGSVYVADDQNHRVQKWPHGATEGITVAGGNGAGSAANQLHGTYGISVDSHGNVYVVDISNSRVQKWAPGATEGTTVAGGNGRGNAANQLSNPHGLFLDDSGNIYITDPNNSRVQKWAYGAIEGITVAGGNGRGSAANQLSSPVGVYVDGSGIVYVSELENHRVQKWAAPTLKTTFTPTAAGIFKAEVSFGTNVVTTNPVTINEPLPVSVIITASPATTITAGTSVTFTATPTNGGDNPVYQWAINGVNVEGETAQTFTTSSLENGDEVTCTLVSNADCASGSPATSNEIIMAVNTHPILDAINNKTIDELIELNFTATASDIDVPITSVKIYN